MRVRICCRARAHATTHAPPLPAGLLGGEGYAELVVNPEAAAQLMSRSGLERMRRATEQQIVARSAEATQPSGDIAEAAEAEERLARLNRLRESRRRKQEEAAHAASATSIDQLPDSLVRVPATLGSNAVQVLATVRRYGACSCEGGVWAAARVREQEELAAQGAERPSAGGSQSDGYTVQRPPQRIPVRSTHLGTWSTVATSSLLVQTC